MSVLFLSCSEVAPSLYMRDNIDDVIHFLFSVLELTCILIMNAILSRDRLVCIKMRGTVQRYSN